MSLKWTGNRSESGILRKSECKEKKEELFVFGYSCKLFRDNEKALHIDQGKHLIPWMGDETLKIDRYDARGALHDLSSHEAPSGGFDWRVELTKAELEVEQLCDEERYRALHTDEDEEEMYKEEELKRLHAAGYGQVGFNYEATQQEPAAPAAPVEVDEPFLPTPAFKALLSLEIVLPESQKQNAIIEKTAKFIASQGAQMEILIKAKQGDNPQFRFLNKDDPLNPYYAALIALVKAGKWPEKEVEVVEEKPPETEEYLHPSLASTVIESAPSIPSIHYRPSADCDYTMLISKMRGETSLDEAYTPELAPGEVAPPGTEPLPPRASAEIARAPVMYNASQPPPIINDSYTPELASGEVAPPGTEPLPPRASAEIARAPLK
ncbi:protein suppressor of white apricot-like [Ostrinia nubilalis]|uniref:protein suppressor of white apricot-like n=1 Tax=Ostrinia nubilalis TaxID=29057 RepID=UPI00308231B5